jgi:hypothetical protein
MFNSRIFFHHSNVKNLRFASVYYLYVYFNDTHIGTKHISVFMCLTLYKCPSDEAVFSSMNQASLVVVVYSNVIVQTYLKLNRSL